MGDFSIMGMFHNMGWVARGVVFTLLIMSIYSIGVMVERWWTFNQATAQSRKYAPEVARLLKAGKIKEAVDASRGAGSRSGNINRNRAKRRGTKMAPSTPRSVRFSARPP
jgi:biopolymer transport protein ExbB/TolQ